MVLNLQLDVTQKDLSSEEIVKEVRLATAVKLFEMGEISGGKAAEVAGISRAEFIKSLARFGVSPIQVTPEELEREINF